MEIIDVIVAILQVHKDAHTVLTKCRICYITEGSTNMLKKVTRPSQSRVTEAAFPLEGTRVWDEDALTYSQESTLPHLTLFL
jgi:hypothetical protein